MITPDNKILSDFYKDSAMKEAVHEYLIEYLKKEAVAELFEGDSADCDAYRIASAKNVIDKAFINLDDTFEAKPKTTGTNSPR